MQHELLNPDNYKVVPFQGLPRIQALKSKTFQSPPLDGSLAVPEMYDWNLKHSPNHPLFVYAEDDGSEKLINWSEGVRAMHRAGRIVHSRLRKDTSAHLFVAFLCATDTITSFLTQIGVIRTGCAIFPISVRNSAPAVAHLLMKTNITHVLVGPEAPYQQLADAALKILRDAEHTIPDTSVMLAFGDIFKDDGERFEPLPPVKFGWDDPVLVQHSSGTTAFPKPIVWSHWRYLQWAIVPYYGGRDITGLRLGIQALPMYHGMGMLQIGWAVTSGVVLGTYKPQIPAVVPTPDNLVQSFVDTKCDSGFCVPVFIEMWARNPAHVQVLKNMIGIMYGGAPLAVKVGDNLAEQGVSIWNLYGLSEAGIMSSVFPTHSPKEWQYFKMADSIKTHFEPQGDGSVELVVLPSPHATPSIMNTVVNGIGAYATSDLLHAHPTRPGYYRIFGRVDDQIVHNNGEKTNPGPLEAILNQDPRVSTSVMFGRGKFNTGVLVDPHPEYKFDPQDTKKLAEFRNLIWPSVEKMNEFAPQHSHLFKEMILVSYPSKPLTFTAKLTPRRQAIINDYNEEIEALYAAAAETTQAAEKLRLPDHWDLTESTSFVRSIVANVLEHPVGDSDDLFQHGCDSLQATWIRNSILHALREGTKVNTRGISASFIYQHPTIADLGRFVSGVANTSGQPLVANGSSTQLSTVQAMLQMAEKYTKDLPRHIGNKPLPSKDVVVVTGTTGALGATLLSHLVETPGVEHVFALNRKGEDGKTLMERQEERLREWGLDAELVRSPKVSLIEIDMSTNHFGLPDEIYEQIRKTVTHIIHNAYRVNFNLSLSSFDPNIRSARNLVDLALSSPYASPARLVFTNTIGIAFHHSGNGPVKEAPVPPESALTSGYTQSKWIVERILQVAHERRNLQCASVRVGQITGSVSGAWNKAEWFPALLRSSQYLGCLPMLDKRCSWISGDAMATALIEMRNSPYSILNLTHPRPVSWSSIITPISHLLNLPLIPFSEWLDRLRASSTNAYKSEEEKIRVNPGLMLLAFYEHGEKAVGEGEAMGLKTMDVQRAVEVAPSLRKGEMVVLGEHDVRRWVRYWKGIGFLA